MREYKVVVDGKEFHVCVEEEKSTGRSFAPAPKAAPKAEAPKAAPAPKAEAPKAAAGTPGDVVAPMPGVILEVKVNVGDQVSEGDLLMIMEAMKMEIEVTSTAGGTVKSIAAAKGATVNTGDTLVVVG